MDSNYAPNYHQYKNFNQINYFAKKEQIYKQQILQSIKEEWEELDCNYKNSIQRKKQGYVIKGYVTRTVMTRLGLISIKRTKYQYFDISNNKKRTFIWLDSQIKVRRYKRVILDLEMAILEEVDSGKRQRDIADQFKDSYITRSTIGQIIRNLPVKDLNQKGYYTNYQIPENIENKKYVYLEVDDTFTTLRDETKNMAVYRIRLATAHLGYVNSKSLKKQLLHKRSIAMIFKSGENKSKLISMEKYAKIISQQLEIFYGDLTNKKIIVCGDGANWIKELALYLQADYILDKYHLMALLFQCFIHRRKSSKMYKLKINEVNDKFNKTIYDRCLTYLFSNEINQLVSYLLTVQVLPLVSMEKQKRIIDLIKYIKNNLKGIQNYSKDYYIGCRTEALISHTVKSLKAYGAKIYSIKTFTNMLNLRIARINQLNLLDIYYTDICHEAEIKNSYFLENFWKAKTNKFGKYNHWATKGKLTRKVIIYRKK